MAADQRGAPAAAGTPARDEVAVRAFVEHMSMTLAESGFPRMPGRVLMAMMSADEPMLTAGELAERLDVSPAAISGAVRYLIQLGMLVRVPMPGSRRDGYRIPNEGWYLASMTRGNVYTDIAAKADEGVLALGGRETPAGARVAEMADFLRFLGNELGGLLAKWEATRDR
jgi:hypothetical protein